MAKLTLKTLTSAYRSNANLNDNFDAIEVAMENTLSRDGTTPNAMSADLDMGSQRAINAGTPINAADLVTKAYADSLIGSGAVDPTALKIVNNLSDLGNLAVSRSNLGLGDSAVATIGTGVQVFSSNLTAFLGVAILPEVDGAANYIIETDGAGNLSWVAQASGGGSGDLLAANNLSDVVNVTTSQQNLAVEPGVDVLVHDANLQTFVTGYTLPAQDAGDNTKFLQADAAGNLDFVSVPGGGDLLASNNLSDVGNVTTSQQNLSVEPGVDVLVHDDNLQSMVNTFVLPTSDGTVGQVLETDGSGNLTFEDGGSGDMVSTNNLSDLSNAGTSRTNLGVAIGSDVQAHDTNLTSFLSALDLPVADGTIGQFLKTDGSGNLDFDTIAGGGDLLAANNLSDLDNVITARNNLGVQYGVDATDDVLAYDDNLQGFVDTFSVPATDGDVGHVMKTDGSATLALAPSWSFHVDDFGAIGDGTTDDAAAIQAAIDAAKTAGGGVVEFGPNIYLIKSTINVLALSGGLCKGIVLRGHGGGYGTDGAISTLASTTIKWHAGTAGDVMLRMGSNTGATNIAANCGVLGITIDCNAVATKGIYVTSIHGWRFEDIAVMSPVTYGMHWDCLDAKVGSDPADNQGCVVTRFRVEAVDAQGDCIFFDGNDGTGSTLGANTSLNHFEMITLGIRDGNGLIFGFSDACTLISFFCFRPGVNTGIGLIFKNDTANKQRHARHHILYHIQSGVPGVLAEGDETDAGTSHPANTNPSFRNSIFGFNLGNTGVNNFPDIEGGATMSLLTQSTIHGLAGPVVAVNSSTDTGIVSNAETQLAAMGAESLRVYNGSSSHMVLTNNTETWGITINGGTGDLRMNRSAGSGLLTVNTPINTDGNFLVDNIAVVKNQGASVANATDAASAITQLNLVISRLEVHGLIAT